MATLILVLVLGASSEAKDIRTKVLGIDSFGNVHFAIRCTVINHDDDYGKVFVHLQALDSDDFEIDTVLLVVDIEVGEKKVVTDRDSMKFSEWRRIRKWVVKSIR